MIVIDKTLVASRPRITRTFRPVGQGAFYTEVFSNCNSESCAVVYDCGTESSQQYLIDSINTLKDEGVSEIEYLFVSHFHHDHISQISYLLSVFNVKRLVLPVLAPAVRVEVYLDNYLAQDGTIDQSSLSLLEAMLAGERIQGVAQVIRVRLLSPEENVYVSSNTKTLDTKLPDISEVASNTRMLCGGWQYIPCNYPCDKATQLARQFKTAFPGLYDAISESDFGRARKILSFLSFDRIKALYDNVYGENHNEESMTVLSCPIWGNGRPTAYCLYTGDSPFRDSARLDYVKLYYRMYWDKIGTLQSPHHGSDPDNPSALHDISRTCVICYGKNNRHGHPGQGALSNMTKCIIKPVTEDPKSAFSQSFMADGDNWKME